MSEVKSIYGDQAYWPQLLHNLDILYMYVCGRDLRLKRVVIVCVCVRDGQKDRLCVLYNLKRRSKVAVEMDFLFE